MRIVLTAALLLTTTTILSQEQDSSKTMEELRYLASQAKKSGDLQQEANYICKAASKDEKKYGKKCDTAKTELMKMLAQFHADLGMARAEIQRKDYPGALRDLGKIAFGPDKDEAQQLIQQARIASNSLPPEQASQIALQAGRTAYNKGDFDAAETLLRNVQSPPLQSTANQLLTNIKVYRDTMMQAAAMAHNGDFKGATQKYQFAIMIQPNGPGQPQEQLRQAQDAQALMDQAKTLQTPPDPAQTSKQEKPTYFPSKVNDAPKIKSLLANAHRLEAQHDLKGAMRAYDAALNLDHQQPDAFAGRERVREEINGDPIALDDSLTQAIVDFYASRFTQASNRINRYIQEGGKAHVGAARFYLGACLLSEALLSDPKDQVNTASLRRLAQEQFMLSKQLHYLPLHSAVSPRIFAEWMQTGNLQ